jgi:hypothetical protein
MGFAKGAPDWLRIQEAVVYYDQCSAADVDHTVNIDFWSGDSGRAERIAVQLDLASARELLRAVKDVVMHADSAADAPVHASLVGAV